MENFVNSNAPISNQVADYLIDWVKKNGLKPGDKIPPELELVQILNTGRSSVREAIAILKSRNIVEVHRGCGTYLCTSPGQVDDPLGLNFVQEGADLASDWGIVRLIIEPSIAELAAVKCTNEDAAELLECWEVLSHSYDDNTKHYEADTKFHEILANATHNVVIKKLFPIIREGIRQFLSETSSLHTDETSRLHYEVMKAVITHDAAKARETMQLLICTNQDLLGW